VCGAKTAEPIEMLFWGVDSRGPKEQYIRCGPGALHGRGTFGEGYTWVWPGSSAVSIINLACKVDAATGYRSTMQARI